MSDKKKFGRPTIALPEADSHLRNQMEAFASSFPGFWKAEWNHTFSPDLMINGKYAFFDQGFTLTPRGGTGLNELQDSVAGVALGSSPDYRSTRPIHTVHLDANYFHGHHEFKAGFYYRTGTVTSSNVPPGDQILALRNPGSGLTASEAVVERASIAKFGGRYLAGYLADTLSRGRLTLNLGLRFDHQQGENKPSTSPANVSFPGLLPDLTYDGSGPAITWNDLSPRLGFTYALTESRKTLVRGSFARYAGQLAWGDLGAVSPVGGIGQLTYHWNDLNGDGFATPDEVDLAKGQLKPPVFATLAGTINQIDPQYHAPHDLEVIAGIERELIPNLAVAAAYTWKRTTGSPWAPFIGLDRSGFTALPPVSANGYTAVAYTPGDASPASFTGGLLLQNRPDYHRQYSGVELTVNKRLSNRWLGRLAFSYANWTEHFTGNGGIQNPTPTLYDTYGYQAFGATVAVDALKDGGQFVTYASGRTGFLGGKWQLSADALYQLPLSFEIAGALFARQGYPLPVNITVEQGFLGTGYGGVLTQAVDAWRLPDLWNLDLRLAKNVKLGGATLTLTADAFNVLNAGTPLTRNPAADSAVFNRLDSILNPRIVRFGARFQF
jgi:hypothetical protein